MAMQSVLLSDFVDQFRGSFPVRIVVTNLVDSPRGQSESGPAAGSTAADHLLGRLSDFGFRSSEVIEWLGRAPLGGPYLFSVRGALVALRGEEIERILVTWQET